MSSVCTLLTPIFIREAIEASCPQALITRAIGAIGSRSETSERVIPLFNDRERLPSAGLYELRIDYSENDQTKHALILFLHIAPSFDRVLWRLWDCRCSEPEWRQKHYVPTIQLDGHMVHVNYIENILKRSSHMLDKLVNCEVR